MWKEFRQVLLNDCLATTWNFACSPINTIHFCGNNHLLFLGIVCSWYNSGTIGILMILDFFSKFQDCLFSIHSFRHLAWTGRLRHQISQLLANYINFPRSQDVVLWSYFDVRFSDFHVGQPVITLNFLTPFSQFISSPSLHWYMMSGFWSPLKLCGCACEVVHTMFQFWHAVLILKLLWAQALQKIQGNTEQGFIYIASGWI